MASDDGALPNLIMDVFPSHNTFSLIARYVEAFHCNLDAYTECCYPWGLNIVFPSDVASIEHYQRISLSAREVTGPVGAYSAGMVPSKLICPVLPCSSHGYPKMQQAIGQKGFVLLASE